MELVPMQEYHNEFLEGYYFVPTDLEKVGPGWFVRAGLSQAKPNFHIGPKHSPYYYLIFVLEGEGRLVQGKHSFHLSPNGLFCLFPQTVQEYYTLQELPMRTMWIALDGKYVGQLLASIGLRPKTPYLLEAVTPAINDWMEDFFKWYRDADVQDSDCARMSRFYLLFDLLKKSTPSGQTETSWLQQALEYMHIHYAEGITVDRVAHYFGIDRSIFSKKFSAHYGTPPGKFLKKLKIDEAKRLLMETDYCIAEIAPMVGYADLYSFSKEFKKSVGFPPNHFRPRVGKAVMLPPDFSNRIINTHGKLAELWLRNVPQLISYCETKWSLRSTCSYQFSAHCLVSVKQANGREAVLKLGIPCRDTYAESCALRHFRTDCMVRLIDSEPDRGILLLEKAMPGTTLNAIMNDENRLEIFANFIRTLHSTDSSVPDKEFPFESTADWSEELRQSECLHTSSMAWLPPLIRQSCTLLDYLHSESGSPRLLHGNLHPDHILFLQSGKWAAISPKGIWGPPEYEAVPFLLGNLPKEKKVETIRHRAKLLAQKTGWRTEILLAWCFCKTVHHYVRHPEALAQEQTDT